MRKILLGYFIFLFAVVKVSSQNVKAFYIGHSLSDQIPDMVKSLSDDHPAVSFDDWKYQSVPGAPLRWNWQAKDRNDYNSNPPYYYSYYHPQEGLRAGDFDVLVLTESVPRHLTPWGIIETYQYADSFFVYANRYNPDIRVFLYEDWHCILSGTPTGCMYDINTNPWRQRLTDDLPMWESVVDTLNRRYKPNNPVCLIPAGQGLAKLYDEILKGSVPGISHINQLFSDDIHLTDIGKYYVACIHFATIHGKTPVGLTNQLKVWWGGNFQAPSPELAKKFQELAWETVTQYAKTCVSGASDIDEIHGQNKLVKFSIYPNPVADELKLNMSLEPGEDYEVFITDYKGVLVNKLSKNTNFVQVSNYDNGLYFIIVKTNDEVSVQKFTKI